VAGHEKSPLRKIPVEADARYIGARRNYLENFTL